MRNNIEIRFKKAAAENAYDIAALAAKMWTSHTVEELAEGFAAAINDPDGAVFLMTDSDKAVGFAQCGLLEYAKSELAIKSSVERYRDYYDKLREQIKKQDENDD